MDYESIYRKFICSRNKRKIEFGTYVETHHITPRCLNGNDDKFNLIVLTAREHFFAHLLLAKINGGKCWFAVREMSRKLSRRTSREYEWVRKKVNKELKFAVENAWSRKYSFKNIEEQREMCWSVFVESEGNTANVAKLLNIPYNNAWRSIKIYSDINGLEMKCKELIRKHKCKIQKQARLNFNETALINWYNGQKNAKRNIKHFERMKTERKGAGNPNFGNRYKLNTAKCPYCGKEGGIPQMKRWHFDNCRKKTNEN